VECKAQDQHHKAGVAESVTDKAASDRHSDSTFSWMTMTWPGND